MSVQSYLHEKAAAAVLSDIEKSSIATSISTLQSRLNSRFSGELSEHFQFGSSTRGTILPRNMDPRSDIDYIIVFKDEDSKPQTYIDRLKRFAEYYYSSSEIAQSNPTVVLKLNHIQFDLVPAIKSYLDGDEYRIPAPASSYQDWMWTSPKQFNSTLSAANKSCDYKLKPAIRLLKYWNAGAGYVFDSYSLEKWCAGQWFWQCSTVRDHLFTLIDNVDLDWSAAQWRKDKLKRAKVIVQNVRNYESNGRPIAAETEVKKLVP